MMHNAITSRIARAAILKHIPIIVDSLKDIIELNIVCKNGVVLIDGRIDLHAIKTETFFSRRRKTD